MKKIIILFLLIFKVTLGQNVNELFAKANSFYKNEKYQEAITLYKQIESSEKISSELYFNIGNCYYKLNKVAPAIYNYEKALKINPYNDDVKNNLIFAKRLTLDRIETVPKTILQRFSENYLQKLSYNNWAKIAILFSVLSVVLFLLYYFADIPSKKRLFFTTSVISFLLLLAFLSITYHQYNYSKNNIEAIIFSDKVSVKSEPTNSSTESFLLHEGTKVFVLDTVDSWKKIKLEDGKIGWLLSESLKEL